MVCLIAVQPPRWDASKVQSLGSPSLMTMIHESQKLIRVVAGHSIWEVVLRHKPPHCPRLPVRSEALGEFAVLVHLFSDQPKPAPLMLGMDFLKEHRCVVHFGEDLIPFPMQSECWWPLFVSSRGLYSMPLCVQPWERSPQAQ